MRVVAGQFKGHQLRSPRRTTRPTADRVREAVFSMLGELDDLDVLDLYAGSGALGIEALSRGAVSAVFVERDLRAAATIKRNLDALGAEAEVRRQDALRFLAAGEGAFDLVFCDPPYDLAPAPAAALAERLPAVTSEDARIVTESDKRRPLELPLPILRERTYGDTRIVIHGG
jgi:16S rRNA (guanine966-N2)-methyltransferase